MNFTNKKEFADGNLHTGSIYRLMPDGPHIRSCSFYMDIPTTLRRLDFFDVTGFPILCLGEITFIRNTDDTILVFLVDGKLAYMYEGYFTGSPNRLNMRLEKLV